jgi:hypothetical protein
MEGEKGPVFFVRPLAGSSLALAQPDRSNRWVILAQDVRNVRRSSRGGNRWDAAWQWNKWGWQAVRPEATVRALAPEPRRGSARPISQRRSGPGVVVRRRQHRAGHQSQQDGTAANSTVFLTPSYPIIAEHRKPNNKITAIFGPNRKPRGCVTSPLLRAYLL